MNVVLYDMDVVLFRCLFAAEHRNYGVEIDGCIKWFPDWKSCKKFTKAREIDTEIWTEHTIEPWENARANIRNTVYAIRKRLQPKQEQFFLSGEDNFRFSVATVLPYKGNRDKAHRPVYLKQGRSFATDELRAITSRGEADDGIGISASNWDPRELCIVTNDKDLKQIPGWHYDFTKDVDPRFIGKREANLYFFQQLLSGDSTDNIPGIEGIGPVGAKELLEGCTGVREAEERCLAAYRNKYGSPEGDRRFLETGRLVYLLRRDGEPLWSPRYIQLAQV